MKEKMDGKVSGMTSIYKTFAMKSVRNKGFSRFYTPKRGLMTFFVPTNNLITNEIRPCLSPIANILRWNTGPGDLRLRQKVGLCDHCNNPNQAQKRWHSAQKSAHQFIRQAH